MRPRPWPAAVVAIDARHRGTRPFTRSCCVGLVVLLCSFLAPASAPASEQSELLYSRGLVEFHAGRYEQALQLFEQAVQADPKDAYALYYRGVTRGRLGNYGGAVQDLRSTRGIKPDLDQAAFELGIALVQTGQDAEAVPALEQAQHDVALDPQASLFLGLAHVRLRQADAARENLQRAAARDPELQVPARYYQGVAEYQARNWTAAEENFSYVAKTSPDSEMGKEATAILEKIRAGEAVRPNVKPYDVYGGVGLQYDSNVKLAPSDDALKDAFGLNNQGDFRTTFLAGGRVIPLRLEREAWAAELSLGYEFFQSLHFRLDDFNLQDHRPYVQAVANVNRFQMGFLGRYDYYLQGSGLNSFLSQGTTLPWFGVAEGSFGRTEVFFRWRRRDFLRQPVDGLLDSNNYSPGFIQYGYIGGPEQYVWIGYRYDREQPLPSLGDAFGYNGHEVSLGVGWEVAKGLIAEASYAFRTEHYFSASDGRVDNEHLITFAGRKQLAEHLWLVAGYFGDINNSNQDVFTFMRHIGSLGLEVRF
jgi:Tfp pilus assembly protein PilF